MEEILRRYQERTPKSAAYAERAREFLPLGVSSNFRFYEPYPIAVAHACGSRLWDVDGNEYIDFALCFGALMAGHAHPVIADAIRRQIEEGTLYGMPHELSVEVTQLLRERFGMEMVRFTSSGVEANMHAIRLARFFTGKTKIVKFEGSYHGAVDTLLVSTKPARDRVGDFVLPNSVPSSHGMPSSVLDQTVIATWNSPESVEAVFRRHDDIAAIILEPVQLNQGVIVPNPGFLQSVKEVAQRRGALVIYDEVKCGCKISWGGAAPLYGVAPDLSTVAKSIGGGTAIGAFGGRREVMEHIGKPGFYHAGTYSGNPLSLAAARAALRNVLTKEAFENSRRLCTALSDGYREIISRRGLRAQVENVGAVGMIHFLDRRVENYRDYLEMDKALWRRYWFSMIIRGIIPQPNGPEDQWTISIQHTNADIAQHLEMFDEVSREMGERS